MMSISAERTTWGTSGNLPCSAWLPTMMSWRSPVISPTARRMWSTCRFFIDLPDFVAGQHSDIRGRLAKARGAFIAPEHRREELAVLSVLQDLLPLVIGGDPDSRGVPAMQVREAVRADLPRRKA